MKLDGGLQEMLGGEKTITKSPSVQLIEKHGEGKLNSLFNDEKDVFVMLIQDENLSVLKLEVKEITEQHGENMGDLMSSGKSIWAFNCDAGEKLEEQDQGDFVYFWTVEKAEEGALLLREEGSFDSTISVRACDFSKDKKQTECSLKVVT